MNKKTTGIIAYITWIGWIVAFCAGDKEGAKFHLNQALVILIGQIVAAVINYIPYVGGIVGTILSIFLFVCWIMGLIYACQEQEKEVPLLGQIKILKNCNYSAAEAAAVSSAVVRFTSSGCSPCRKVMMIWIRL